MDALVNKRKKIFRYSLSYPLTRRPAEIGGSGDRPPALRGYSMGFLELHRDLDLQAINMELLAECSFNDVLETLRDSLRERIRETQVLIDRTTAITERGIQ